MKYMVMECYPSYAVLLDEAGSFVKAANLFYEVGQVVEKPVLIRDIASQKCRSTRWIGAGIVAIASCIVILFGLHYYRNFVAVYSSIYLAINPEVQMDLNRQGTVVALTGTNQDGVLLLEGYDGTGKDKVDVADELIDRAIDMGFLSEGGKISFSIDAPDTLFEEYGLQLQTKVSQHLNGRISVTIEIIDFHNEVSQSDSPHSSDEPHISIPVSPPENDSDYSDSDYGPNNDGVTDDNDTDYGSNNDGVTDYNDTDSEPSNDGVTDDNDTDYGLNNDGATDYSDSDYRDNGENSNAWDDQDDMESYNDNAIDS